MNVARQRRGKTAFKNASENAWEAKTIYSEAIKDTLEKKRSARETRDRDHEGGIRGVHGGRLLQNAPRPTRGNAEALE